MYYQSILGKVQKVANCGTIYNITIETAVTRQILTLMLSQFTDVSHRSLSSILITFLAVDMTGVYRFTIGIRSVWQYVAVFRGSGGSG
jgi:hypothetical protein